MAARLYSKYDLPVPKKFLLSRIDYDDGTPKNQDAARSYVHASAGFCAVKWYVSSDAAVRGHQSQT